MRGVNSHFNKLERHKDNASVYFYKYNLNNKVAINYNELINKYVFFKNFLLCLNLINI